MADMTQREGGGSSGRDSKSTHKSPAPALQLLLQIMSRGANTADIIDVMIQTYSINRAWLYYSMSEIDVLSIKLVYDAQDSKWDKWTGD